MIDTLKRTLWAQFGGSIDMLKNAIAMWPEENWPAGNKFFYNAYHCLVFLDYYLTIPPGDFRSHLNFTIAEPGIKVDGMIDDVMPDRIYTKKELLDYLDSSRRKCHDVIKGLTLENLNRRWAENSGERSPMNYPILEILLYNMRHVQHHAAQLNMILRNTIDNAPRWVGRAKDDL